MKFDLTQDDYEQFIKDLSNEAKDVNRTSHELLMETERTGPVHPPPPQGPAPAAYIDIELTEGGSRTVTVRIRRHDLHLIGYRMDNGQWLEFSGDRQLIPGSEFLGFGENYLHMSGLQYRRRVGYTPLAVAINKLATTTNRDRRRSALRLLAFMICESARSDDLLYICAEQVRELSETDLPRPYWLRHEPRHTDDDIQGKGQPMVEVFSVRIDVIGFEFRRDMYGSITVTDGLGSFYLYDRARDNCESIWPNGTLSLTGPYRSISLSRVFTISLNLLDMNNDPYPDKEISKGSFSRDIFYLSTTNDYDKRLFQKVTGKNGSASVFYAMFEDAVQAEVDVVIINKVPADLYGSIVAGYDNYEYFGGGQNKYYQTKLFNRRWNNRIKIMPGYRISLSRCTVAVPTTSSLIIEADLWDHHRFRPTLKIASGVAIFPPKTNGKSVHDIAGPNGSVRVSVTWNALSG